MDTTSIQQTLIEIRVGSSYQIKMISFLHYIKSKFIHKIKSKSTQSLLLSNFEKMKTPQSPTNPILQVIWIAKNMAANSDELSQ